MSSESQQGSSYRPEDLIRHLWSRRYILIGMPIVAVILGYLGVRAFVPESFESSATLLIRTPPVEYARPLPAHRRVSPPGYETFFETDQVLHEVIQAAREEYPGQVPAGDFEMLKRAFDVRTITTRETTVTAEYSPVILLRARGGSPEIAHFLVETWIRLSNERFGAIRFRDAQEVRAAFEDKFETTSEVMAEQLAERDELQRRLDEMDMLLDTHRRLLSGQVTSRQRFDMPTDLRLADPGAGGGQFEPTTFALFRFLFEQIAREPLPDDLDLYTERTRLELRVAELQDFENAEEVRELRRAENRLARVEELIDRSFGELAEIGRERDALASQVSRLNEKVRNLEDQLVETRKVLAGTAIESTSVMDPFHPDYQGAFSVIGAPVVPETRAAPPRTLLAIAIGIIFGGLLLLLVVAEFYLKRVLEEEPQRS